MKGPAVINQKPNRLSSVSALFSTKIGSEWFKLQLLLCNVPSQMGLLEDVKLLRAFLQRGFLQVHQKFFLSDLSAFHLTFPWDYTFI